MAVGCSGDEWSGADSERVDEAELALSNTGPEIRVATVPSVLTDPSVAWIGSKDASRGRMLITFGSDRGAGWTRSDSPGAWWSSPAGYQAEKYWNDMSTPWPQPDNFCTVYNCPIGTVVTKYDRPRAVWSGLSNVGLAVSEMTATGGFTDVVVHTSTDGGSRFSRGYILSLPVGGGAEDSGGAIWAQSVHVALPQDLVLFTEDAASWSMPVYVVWKNTDPRLGTTKWWMTKFVVGIDGTVAEIAEPRSVSNTPIPSTDVANAAVAITGYTEGDGNEVTELFWGVPDSALPACPSSSTRSVTWKRAFSRDFGGSWSTPEIVDSDANWKPCVAGGGAGLGENNLRPEVMPHRGRDSWNGTSWDALAPWTLFAAINKSSGPSTPQKIVLRRYISGSGWSTAFTSTGTDDAWKQALSMHVGKYSGATTTAITGVTWREKSGSTIFTKVVTGASFGSWTQATLSATSTSLVSAGLFTGLAFEQTCLWTLGSGGTCSPGAVYPNFAAVSGWVQNAGGQSEVWVRKFQH